jgi:hypothetical protein
MTDAIDLPVIYRLLRLHRSIIQSEIKTRFRHHGLVTSVTLKGLALPTLLAAFEC